MRLSCVAAVMLLVPSVATAVEYVNDPLTADTAPGRGGTRGGTFSANGWTTTAGTDTIWYEITDALESGSIEYTVTGVEVGTTLTGADHDILAVYQAPDGVGEPVAYAPYFRNNDMKVFTRIFGTLEVGRPGAMKLELHACMVGQPYYDNTCPAACGIADALAYARGNQNDLGWDPAHAYRMGLSWGGGMMSFSRDGEVLATIPYEGTYAPRPLRIRLGSPRHDNGPVQMMPVGITFRDVLINGTPGSMSLACGQEPPDASVPPVDAGTGPVDAGSNMALMTVLQDVTAASWETGVFPDVADLNVEADGTAQPQAVVYLRFPAPVGTVQNARLLLHTQFTSSAAGGSGTVCLVNDVTWSETTVTWANKPPFTTLCAGAERQVFSDAEVEWDVTALVVAGGTINLAVVSHDGNGVHYFSKESGGAMLGPRLLLTTTPATMMDAGSTPDAAVTLDAAVGMDAAVGLDAAPRTDAATGRDAAAGMDAAGTRADAAAPADAGTESPPSRCDCHGAGTAQGGVAGLLLLWGVAFAVRRRSAPRAGGQSNAL